MGITKKLKLKTTMRRVHINFVYYLWILFSGQAVYDHYWPPNQWIDSPPDILTVHLVAIDSKTLLSSVVASGQM